MLCEIPVRKAARYSFELTWGDGAYQTSTGITYTYDPDPHAIRLSPAHVSLQAYANSVRIGVTGANFLATPDLAVRIADWV